jgi:GT2 family glycosyltransferase
VDFLNGCAMLIHRSVFDRIGRFDPSYFMYAEEVDFCWRARNAGFKMAVVPTAKMWHKVSASSPVREKSLLMQIRSQSIFYRRYSTGFKRVFMFLFSSLRAMIIGVRYLILGKKSLSRAVFLGWKNGWFGMSD